MVTIPQTIRSTDGVTVHLHDLGGSGPPLLLCHATGFCGPVWQPMAEKLSSEYHCVALDFRAHGRSTRPTDRPLEWGGFADDVLAVKTAISPDRPVAAVGHSMGGAALILAEDAVPGTLSKAWTFEPILFSAEDAAAAAADPDSPGEPEIAIAARRRRAVFANRDEAFQRYRARPPLSVLDERALQAYVDHGFEDLPDGSVTLRCLPEDEASVFQHHASGADEAIGRLTIPFAASASGDGQRPAEAVVAAAARYPRLELHRYEDLTHFGPLQAPERLAADVLTWMATA